VRRRPNKRRPNKHCVYSGFHPHFSELRRVIVESIARESGAPMSKPRKHLRLTTPWRQRAQITLRETRYQAKISKKRQPLEMVLRKYGFKSSFLHSFQGGLPLAVKWIAWSVLFGLARGLAGSREQRGRARKAPFAPAARRVCGGNMVNGHFSCCTTKEANLNLVNTISCVARGSVGENDHVAHYSALENDDLTALRQYGSGRNDTPGSGAVGGWRLLPERLQPAAGNITARLRTPSGMFSGLGLVQK